MKGSRPEQAVLTRDNDLRCTAQTQRVVEAMVDGLNDHVIDGIGAFFAPDFRWLGNAGCGTKHGLRAFQDHWQRPFQAAFSDKVCIDEARIVQGQWMAAFGRQEATHSGEFMAMVAKETWRTVAMATAGVTLALVIAIPLTLVNTRVLSVSALSGRMAALPYTVRQAVRPCGDPSSVILRPPSR
jgi:ABC-type phosphate/phosphonate transport system permease subunit